jgi:hypothetical protein
VREEVMTLKVNRSEKRARTSPASVVGGLLVVGVKRLVSTDVRRALRAKQLPMFGDEGPVNPDGSRRRD